MTVLAFFFHPFCLSPDFFILTLSAGQSVGPAGAVTRIWAIFKRR